jgi:hypothetical protein
MASDNTVQAFNEMKQIYMESVAPDALVESRQNLLERTRRLVNTPQQSRDYGDVASHVRTLRTTGRFANAPTLEPGTENSSDSLFNAFKTAEVLGGVVPRIVSTESYSNWREEFSDIFEEIEKDEDQKEIKVKPNIKNTVIINPEISSDNLKEAFSEYNAEVISSEELNEDFLYEAAEIATEYFYECGLNQFGVEELIESLGEQKFIDFVFDLSEDYQLDENCLLEWRRGPNGTRVGGNQTTKSGKHFSQVKGAAKNAAARATPEHKERKKAKESEDTGSNLRGELSRLSNRSAQLRKASVAKKTDEVKKNPVNVVPTNQPSKQKTTTKEQMTKGIFGRIKDRAQQDIGLLKKSVNTARNVGINRAAEVKATYDALRSRGRAIENSPEARAAREKLGKAAQVAGRVAGKAVKAAAGAAGAGAGRIVAGQSIPRAAGAAAGTFVRNMQKEEVNVKNGQEVFDALRRIRRDHGKERSKEILGPTPKNMSPSETLAWINNRENAAKEAPKPAPGTVGFPDGTTLSGDAARQESLRRLKANRRP